MFLQAVLNLQIPVEHSKEVNDCKHLIKTLIMGNKFSFVIALFELVCEFCMLFFWVLYCWSFLFLFYFINFGSVFC